jgi:hypothetical protein
MMPAASGRREHPQHAHAALGDGRAGRQQRLLKAARAEVTLLCSVACKVAAAVLLMEGLFRIAVLGQPLMQTQLTAAAAVAQVSAQPLRMAGQTR